MKFTMRNAYRFVFVLLPLFLLLSACGQVDPVSVLSSLKGENAERAAKLTAKIMGIRTGDHKVRFTNNLMVPMRDGLRLATDVFEPLPQGKYPVIMCRMPYEKKKWSAIGYIIASNGYVFVIQDTRSSGESEGKNLIPVISDHDDGHDTIEWIKEQAWYNGRLSSWGASFFGRTQLLVSDHPDMTCIYPQYTSIDFAGGHRGGANLHEGPVTWIARTGHHELRVEGKRKEVAEKVRERIMSSGFYNRPLDDPWRVDPRDLADKDLEGILQVLSDKFGEELSWSGSGYSGEMMNKMRQLLFTPGIPEGTMGFADPLDFYRNMQTPALFISGWYDVLSAGALEHYTNIKKYATGDAKEHTRIVIGPWAHVMPGRHDAPQGGPNGGQTFSTFRSVFIFDWWDYWLKGIDNEFMNTPPIHIYVMGRNEWRCESEWPLKRTRWTKFYLHSCGGANSVQGNGVLSPEKPGDEPADEYDYDPHDPVPTLGGCKLLSPSGSMDQREAEERMDVLVYTSEELGEDLEVTGPLTGYVYAASSARDTDFVVKLVDVYPDGRATLINDGIIRARFRNGLDNPSLIEPGKVYLYEIDMWATSNVFLKGHRIRVEVSSSNFPRYDRNTNLGGAPGEPIVAHQVIYHDTDHPSQVLLPVIP